MSSDRARSNLLWRSLPLIIFIAISLALSSFYVRNGITAGSDVGLHYIYLPSEVLQKMTAIWREGIHGIRAYAPLRALFSLSLAPLRLIPGPPGAYIQSYFYFALSFFISFFGAYLFLKRIGRATGARIPLWAIILSSIMYVFAPIPIVYRFGYLISILYQPVPLFSFFILDIILEENRKRWIPKILLYSSIASVLSTAFFNPLILIGLAVIGIVLTFFFRKEISWRSLGIKAALSFLALLWIPTSIYFAIPSFIHGRLVSFTFLSHGLETWISHYTSSLQVPNSLAFYPIKFWRGLSSYGGYYSSPWKFLLWTLMVCSLFSLSMLSKKYKGLWKLSLLSLSLYAVSEGLMIFPKLFPSLYVWIMKNYPLMLAFRNTYDKFNYILQMTLPMFFSISIATLLRKLKEIRVQKRIKKIVALSFAIFLASSSTICALPLILGWSSHGISHENMKAKIPLEYFELEKLDEKLCERDPSAWNLFIPYSTGYWIFTDWFFGSDYAYHLPGKISSGPAINSEILMKIRDLLSSPDLIFNVSLQHEVLRLLSIGNFKYVTIRGDVNLDKQASRYEQDSGMGYMVLNMLYLAKKYGFKLVKIIGDPNLSKALYLRGGDSWVKIPVGNVTLKKFEIEVVLRKAIPPTAKRDLSLGDILCLGNAKLVNIGRGGLAFFFESNGKRRYLLSSLAIQNTAWQRIAILCDGRHLTMTSNGEVVGKVSLKGGFEGIKVSGAIILGYIPGEGGPWIGDFISKERSFSGLIKEVKIVDLSNDKTLIDVNFEKINLGGLERSENGSSLILADPGSPTPWYIVYENPYALGEAYRLLKNGSALKVSYERISPTKYVVSLNSSGSVALVLAEDYDRGWEAKVYKDGRLVEVVPSSPSIHGMNEFRINASGSLRVVILFKPEKCFELSAAISSGTLLGLSALVGIEIFRKRRK